MQMFETPRWGVGPFGINLLPVYALVLLGLVPPSTSWAQQSPEAAEKPEVPFYDAVLGPLTRDITTAYLEGPGLLQSGPPDDVCVHAFHGVGLFRGGPAARPRLCDVLLR